MAKGTPGNRPRGAPRGALKGVAAWYLLVGASVVELANLLPFATGAGPTSYMIAGVALAAVVTVTVTGGIGAGRLWAVRLFRWTSLVAAGLYLPILAAGIWLDSGDPPPDGGLAFVIFSFAVLKLGCLALLFATLRRVRWLDPSSLPHEWEPPSAPVRYP